MVGVRNIERDTASFDNMDEVKIFRILLCTPYDILKSMRISNLKVFCGIEPPENNEIFSNFRLSINSEIEEAFYRGLSDELNEEDHEILNLRMVAASFWFACGLELKSKEIYSLCKKAERQGYFVHYLVNRAH